MISAIASAVISVRLCLPVSVLSSQKITVPIFTKFGIGVYNQYGQ